jgi:hypothetical protein
VVRAKQVRQSDSVEMAVVETVLELALLLLVLQTQAVAVEVQVTQQATLARLVVQV